MIIGREREQEILTNIATSGEAELVALYGRRRVGKTYLIREFFKKQPTYLEITGQKDASLKLQLQNFINNFSEKFYPGLPLKVPGSWNEAFEILYREILKIKSNQNVILFFDEIPWLASKKSGFLETLEYYWNNKFSALSNVKLIVCGSAAAWVIDKIINNKGGLYNRVTKQILLEPFNIKEAKEYLTSRGIKINKTNMLQLYMALGGIPYYLKQVEKGESAHQAINRLFFSREAPLRDEFERLFASLFEKAEIYQHIVEKLAMRPMGIAREELLQELNINSGGRFTNRLEELEASGFIKKWHHFNASKTRQYYILIDELSLFCLYWLKGKKTKNKQATQSSWLNLINTPGYFTWAGFAFENMCIRHIEELAEKLDITNLGYTIGSFLSREKKSSTKGPQIDMIIDREDNAINLCEIKYSSEKYSLTKEEAMKLKNKITRFMENYPDKQIFLTLISSCGIKKNIWTEDLIDKEVNFQELL